jgi:cytochrome c-type biogenesis protein CcmH/NrfG
MTVLLVLVLLLMPVAAARAVDDDPLPVPQGAPAVSAQSRFNDGLALARKKDWAGAEQAYRDALRLDPSMPEGWNGLGFALRNQKKYPESIAAYEEALTRRPKYAQALEYLGEAYVQMGRLDEARAIHTRLQPLDAREARELAKAIEKAARR